MSLPGKNCPWISLATAFGFPNSSDMENAPPHATDTWTHIGTLAGVVALKSLGSLRERPRLVTETRGGSGVRCIALSHCRPLEADKKRINCLTGNRDAALSPIAHIRGVTVRAKPLTRSGMRVAAAGADHWLPRALSAIAWTKDWVSRGPVATPDGRFNGALVSSGAEPVFNGTAAWPPRELVKSTLSFIAWTGYVLVLVAGVVIEVLVEIGATAL